MRKTGRKDGDVDEIAFETWATSSLGEKARIVLSRGVAVASRLQRIEAIYNCTWRILGVIDSAT